MLAPALLDVGLLSPRGKTLAELLARLCVGKSSPDVTRPAERLFFDFGQREQSMVHFGGGTWGDSLNSPQKQGTHQCTRLLQCSPVLVTVVHLGMSFQARCLTAPDQEMEMTAPEPHVG